MRILALTVVLAVLVLCAQAQAKVACGDGTTAFVDGKLRIFGIHYRTPDETGFEEYACLGRRMKPLYVGGIGADTGVGFGETQVYAHAGRFLASYDFSDGEGGPGADVSVMDLRRRRSVVFMNLACCEGVPPLRVAPDGTAVVLGPGDGVLVKSPGRRRARALSGENARDLAMHGGTVYWSEAGQARSAQLDGIGGREATALEPVRLHRRGGACAAARGRTIAATGSVRVFAFAGERFGCRIGRAGKFDVERGAVRIVADRWVLVRDGDRARVFDSKTGRTVADAREVAQATLLADGTLAWIDAAGAVHVATPSGTPLVVGEGASRLAAARRTVYWTDATGPQRFPGKRPPAG